jgi:peptide/nickel transport system permease protein
LTETVPALVLETAAGEPLAGVALPGRRRLWRVFAQNRLALAGLGVLGLIVFASLLGPVLSPYDSTAQDVLNRLQPPSWQHPMGTDELGRDTMTRILEGGRLSLAIGALAALAAVVIGVVVGSLAGLFGRWVDTILMRTVDLALSLPDLFVLILASALLGPSVGTMILIISLVRWMNVARLVRGSFLSLREREFVEAARAVGVGRLRLVRRHLLPNSLSPVIVAATLAVASGIIAESTLSFLGLGLQPPASSWGTILRNAQAEIFTSPWMAVFPGVMIFLTVIAINFVGDGLRDALDPATRRAPRGSMRRWREVRAEPG